jgi:hypothetical protein
MIPLTRLHLEPLPPVTPPADTAPAAVPVGPPPAAVPLDGTPPPAISLVQPHRGGLAVFIAFFGSGVALGICLAGYWVGVVLGGGLVGLLPGALLGWLASTLAWCMAQFDLARIDRGVMDEGGRLWALRGRWAGQVFSIAWGIVTYTLVVFEVGFFLGKAV